MNRPQDSLVAELSRMMTAHPATVSLLLPNSAFHSPTPAAQNQQRRLSDRAGTARLVRMVRMWIGRAQS